MPIKQINLFTLVVCLVVKSKSGNFKGHSAKKIYSVNIREYFVVCMYCECPVLLMTAQIEVSPLGPENLCLNLYTSN